MNELGEMEMKFANLIWSRAPIGSGELVRLCEAEFGWKKSTTYTMGGTHKTVNRNNSLICCSCSCTICFCVIVYNQTGR